MLRKLRASLGVPAEAAEAIELQVESRAARSKGLSPKRPPG